MYNENNEDSAKALGLYNVLSNQATAFILHTLQSILDILAVLSKSIQTKAADFKRLQDVISPTILRLEELKDYSSIDYVNILETIQKLLLVSSTIRNSSSSISNVQLNIDYGDKEMYTIQQHYSSDFDKSIIYEWRTFHTYLLDKKKGGAEIFLIAPISTATAERDLSTMNRVLTKLRNRLTTEHVDQLRRISVVGVDIVNEEMKEKIINYRIKVKPRRLTV
ncbi:unnamed protein product [Rotaria magnacalcarata]|uniref:HAT C-terminal dimerisation domain-containing protein n=1 Tax=Rotaria magnacalcarata TaxID=392030 RepID=A0A8S2WM85_9BILA|nr:unnamed protein product [Rotaria magnacalcarata]